MSTAPRAQKARPFAEQSIQGENDVPSTNGPAIGSEDVAAAGATRTETDSLGSREVPADAYWGIHTARALENFPITIVEVRGLPGKVLPPCQPGVQLPQCLSSPLCRDNLSHSGVSGG